MANKMVTRILLDYIRTASQVAHYLVSTSTTTHIRSLYGDNGLLIYCSGNGRLHACLASCCCWNYRCAADAQLSLNY